MWYYNTNNFITQEMKLTLLSECSKISIHEDRARDLSKRFVFRKVLFWHDSASLDYNNSAKWLDIETFR